MTPQITLTHQDIENLCLALGNTLASMGNKPGVELKCFPIPRGGVPAAYALDSHFGLQIVDNPEEADFFFDDIIDSGATVQKWCDYYPERPFLALIDKTAADCEYADSWVIFPWENQTAVEDDTIVGTLRNRLISTETPFMANDNIAEVFAEGELVTYQAEVERRLQYLLDGLLIDTENDHNTQETAKRVAKMYLHEVFKGRYHPAPKITSFPNAKQLDEMYVTGPISIRSACSHHLVPIMGECYIGIIPSDNVIGLSKFNRIVDWIASRPQMQEELVMQIADFIEEEIKPVGLGVVIKASHLCMTWRGVKEQPNASMITSVLRGAMKEQPAARAEFISLVK